MGFLFLVIGLAMTVFSVIQLVKSIKNKNFNKRKLKLLGISMVVLTIGIMIVPKEFSLASLEKENIKLQQEIEQLKQEISQLEEENNSLNAQMESPSY